MTAAGFPAPGWSLRHKVPRPHHTGDCCCMLCRDQMSSFTDHGKGNSNHRHHTTSICISIVQSPIALFERLLVTTGGVFVDGFVTCQESRHSHYQCQPPGVWSILQVSSVCLRNTNWPQEGQTARQVRVIAVLQVEGIYLLFLLSITNESRSFHLKCQITLLSKLAI